MPEKQKKILLLSPYDTLSHQYWWKGLELHLSEYHWTILTLEPRYYSWRIRGNSLSWAFEKKEELEKDYDLLIACSLTDLSSLRGFIPKLASVPTIVYCHENQFFYPDSPSQTNQAHRLEQQMIQIYNFICADLILFNSAFNQQSCFEGIDNLIRKLPDHVPANLTQTLKSKSRVLPIPLNTVNLNPETSKSSIFSIVWNHRWEYDKGLTQLSALIDNIIENKLPCRIHLLGQQFRNTPEEMLNITEKIKSSGLAGHIGFVENKENYYQILKESHVVLSTSLHEFQGLAVMEAVQHGCVPVLPNRLSYPEFFSQEFLYESHIENTELESKSAFSLIENYFLEWKNPSLTLESKQEIKNIPDWKNKKAAYQQVIDSFSKAT